jgi:outer membrane protein
MHHLEIELSTLKTAGYHNMEVSKILSILLKIVIYILLLFSKRDALTQQMSLGECVKQAIENHPDIKASYLQTGMSQAGIDQAKSNFLPQLGANIHQSGNFGRSIDRFTNAYIDQFYNTTWAGVQLNMPLFTSFRNSHLLTSAKSGFLASESAQENAKNTMIQAVLAAYINGLAQQESIKNSEKQLQNDSIQYQRLMKRKDAGLITKTEEIQLLNQLKADELVLIDAQLNYEIAIAELSRLLNNKLSYSTKLAPLEPSNPINILVSPAVNDRLPQFAEAKWRLQAIRDNIKATKAQSYPSIDLSAGYGTFYASSNPNRSFTEQLNDTRNGSISIGITIPILRGMQNRPQVQVQKVRETMIQNELELTKLQLSQDLNLAFTRYKNLTKRYETANLLYQLSEENMHLIQDQVSAGTATMIDFLLAQTNMERALASRTNAKYQLIHQEKLLTFYTSGKFDFGE